MRYDSWKRARRRRGNIRLRIAFFRRGTRDYGYETLQSLPRSTWLNRASDVDASVLLEVGARRHTNISCRRSAALNFDISHSLLPGRRRIIGLGRPNNSNPQPVAEGAGRGSSQEKWLCECISASDATKKLSCLQITPHSPRAARFAYRSRLKPVSFDGRGHIPARKQIVYCLILTREREP